MKNLKNLQKHGLAVFALTLALGYGSYSYAKSLLATNWYQISSQGASPGADVIGAITADPTQGGICTTPIKPVRCAVQFDNSNNFNLTGLQVAIAEALPGVNETSRTHKLP
ncbi:hypothetical protein [Sphingobacterium sp. MYb388]|uniref:hypothetical protein n=1 Tax=Sphingobacterium sp. MYb388 TaxID=2745437 RepID=UPI0030B77031